MFPFNQSNCGSILKTFLPRASVLLLFTMLLCSVGLHAMPLDQTGADLSLAMVWTGKPIVDKAPGNMVAFRKQFEVATLPQKAMVHLFADVRYMLWVNGRYVERGPVRFERQRRNTMPSTSQSFYVPAAMLFLFSSRRESATAKPGCTNPA